MSGSQPRAANGARKPTTTTTRNPVSSHGSSRTTGMAMSSRRWRVPARRSDSGSPPPVAAAARAHAPAAAQPEDGDERRAPGDGAVPEAAERPRPEDDGHQPDVQCPGVDDRPGGGHPAVGVGPGAHGDGWTGPAAGVVGQVPQAAVDPLARTRWCGRRSGRRWPRPAGPVDPVRQDDEARPEGGQPPGERGPRAPGGGAVEEERGPPHALDHVEQPRHRRPLAAEVVDGHQGEAHDQRPPRPSRLPAPSRPRPASPAPRPGRWPAPPPG